jgi:7-dehydrocholesterol reductase
MLKSLRHTLGPLGLMLACPPFVMLMWYTNTTLNGSASQLLSTFQEYGFFNTIYRVWAPYFWGSGTAWFMIATFAIFQLMLLRFMPGKPFSGPVTPNGNIPKYTANGFACYLVTMGAFCLCTFVFNLFPATIIYDELGYILGALNISSLIVCALLYLKGRYAPSSSDSGVSGQLLFDYYWGTELYPVVSGINIKQYINCRLGMMSWGIFLIAYAAKQSSLFGLSNSMMVSVGLQLLYITKFFIWETGYLRSLDIMHDRAGFYICWGCLVWVPCVYTSPSMYLVLHPNDLGTFIALAITVVGAASILINFSADRQRQLVRATNGNCTVWGKPPVTTRASYTTTTGEKKENLLLASGWWGVARHFHYVPEILGAFCWTLPALFLNVTPYFYVIFLTILLIDRAYRDDERCAQKYGNGWLEYCRLVPYKIIPFVI